jgi:hypothetical protein
MLLRLILFCFIFKSILRVITRLSHQIIFLLLYVLCLVKYRCAHKARYFIMDIRQLLLNEAVNKSFSFVKSKHEVEAKKWAEKALTKCFKIIQEFWN